MFNKWVIVLLGILGTTIPMDVSAQFDGYSENQGTYVFNSNGSLKKDPSKAVRIQSGYNNLPFEIVFRTGDTINYQYSSSGEKLSTIVTEADSTKETNYFNGVEYESSQISIYTPYGVRRIKGSNLETTYFQKDHLGNTRVTSLKNQHQPIAYYPFGLQHASNKQETNEKVLFASKEKQNNLCLNYYDFGARSYNPEIGLWNQIDPLASKYASYSPFNYVLGNPISLIDPNGMEPVPAQSGPGPNPEYPLIAQTFLDGISGILSAAINDRERVLEAIGYRPYGVSQRLVNGEKVYSLRKTAWENAVDVVKERLDILPLVDLFIPGSGTALAKIPRIGTAASDVIEIALDKLLAFNKVNKVSLESIAKNVLKRGGYDNSEPIRVVELPNKTFMVLDGNNRVGFMKKRKEKTIPATVEKWADMEPEQKRLIIIWKEDIEAFNPKIKLPYYPED